MALTQAERSRRYRERHPEKIAANRAAEAKAWREANPDKTREYNAQYSAELKQWRIDNPGVPYRRPRKKKVTKDLWLARLRVERPEHAFVIRARTSAAAAGVPFDLIDEDIFIPEFCPVFGTRLDRNDPTRKNNPTLDRVIPELGYVKGNVLVISWEANRLKNNATLEQLALIVDYIKRETGQD